MGPPHHLDGRNTVTAQVEERVIDADTFQAQHLGVDPGQYLLYERGRGTVMIDVGPLTVNGNAAKETTAAGTI
ncbi:Uncharacterised protein [Mycobacteroides abscessus subsp. abscessus]|nr:Uncharacterised protein [Mycobacteroides abscessus subsp. abscessus]